MRKSRVTEAQIIGMLKEQEAGMPRDFPRRRSRPALAMVTRTSGVPMARFT
ncbi:hypothetical protein EV658_1021 [Phaeovulum veldkampii DSM 11550]|nr:hypothetical protein EV658_1021 [Phaeovulum veldkampii DSM 11550]